MTTQSPPAAALPLFIPISDFPKYGLPGRTRAYELAARGLLDLRKLNGRTGLLQAEALRYAGTAQPIGQVKRDTSRGTAASLKARGVAA